MPVRKRIRLDDLLVLRKLFSCRKEAAAAILSGQCRDVRSGDFLDKPGTLVAEDLSIRMESQDSHVGRGFLKLEAFLKELSLDYSGLMALDVGASTGGFTECLLKSGVKGVYAVDVGRGQLHDRLRRDPRVHVFEEVDIREFDFSALAEKPKLVVVDVSFISLRHIVPHLYKCLPDSVFAFLFKPQFEIDRFVPKKRGIAPAIESEKALQEMLLFLKQLGLNPLMVRDSVLKGQKGNQETFILAAKPLPAHIFRTYDIRGVAETDLLSADMERVGEAYGQIAGEGSRIGVGRDARVSSPRIYESFVRGLSRSKIKIVDLGLTATPMAYFAHYHFDLDGIVQITASHNPKDDNGLKMMLRKNTLFGDDIQKLRSMASSIVPHSSSLSVKGEDLSSELLEEYIQYLKGHFKFSRSWRIGLDCGNGMVGLVAQKVFSPISDKIEILYEEVDCRFPNHEADPTIPANLKDLQQLVTQNRLDIGFAFDGDGDRLGVITPSGRILWGDEILMLLSELVLKQRPGSIIIGEVKCSEKLFKMIRDRGGEPLMYKTGHSLIKKKMKELGAPIAGEMSGHLFFADRYFGFDDAVYGALRVLEVIDHFKIDLDAWISKFPKSFLTPELRVTCEESEKGQLVERVIDYFRSFPGAHLNLIDGIRVGFEDGSWALVRASNTQAVLVVRIEAVSEDSMKRIRRQIEEALDKKLPA